MSRIEGWRGAAGRGASSRSLSELASWAPRLLVAIPLALGASGCTSDDASVEPGGAAIEEHNAEAAQAVNAGTTCVVLRRQGGTKAIDSFVSEEKKDNNYGASSFAGITGAAGNVTRALFRFDLGAIPSNATILNAGLSLTQNNTGAAVARVHVLNGQWDEATVTWNKLGATFGPAVTAVPNDKATMSSRWDRRCRPGSRAPSPTMVS